MRNNYDYASRNQTYFDKWTTLIVDRNILTLENLIKLKKKNQKNFSVLTEMTQIDQNNGYEDKVPGLEKKMQKETFSFFDTVINY